MQQDQKFLTTIGGAELSAEISPCSWAYPTYGLQIRVSMKDGGNCYVHRKDLPWAKATEADAQAMLATVKVKPCSKCGSPAFDPDSADTNREGLCERCFIEQLDAEFAAAEQKEKEAIAARDAEMKAKGFKWRVTGWVHAPTGDDTQLDMYFSLKPTKRQIKNELEKAGSLVTHDHGDPIEL